MRPGEYIKISKSNQSKINAFINKNEYIYRYLPMDRMLATLQKATLTFVNPDKWKDPFDNFLFKQTLRAGSTSFLKSLYCLCFTLNPHSQAYWENYSSDGFAARFKINTKNFINFLLSIKEPVWLGKMEYLYESKLVEKIKNIKGLKEAISRNGPNDLFLKAFHYKRMPFKYEEEIRILIKGQENPQGLRKYKIDIRGIIEEIRLDPRISKPEELAWKDYLKKFDIKTTKSQFFIKKNILLQ